MNEKIIDLFNKDYSFLVIIIIIMFFILFGLSQNIFLNLFGCNIRFLFKTPIVRHLLVIIMFFLILDFGINYGEILKINPLISFAISIGIYLLLYSLSHMNTFFILFVCILLFLILILTKVNKYYENSITDQEILRGKTDFIYKFHNVLVIIIVLSIVIGLITSTNKKNLYNGLFKTVNKCKNT